MAHIIQFDEENVVFDSIFYWDQLLPDSWPDIHGVKSRMSRDVIPQAKGARYAWYLQMKNSIATVGPTFGLTTEKITAIQATCASTLGAMDETAAKEAELKSAREAEKLANTIADSAMREEMGDWKRMAGFDDTKAAALGMIPSQSTFNPDEYKCEFKIRIVGGEIRIDWKKMGAYGVHIYSRLAGQTVWVRIGTDTSSPYIDGRELAQPRVPETREYMLRGIDIVDREIGVDSDIQSITWAGQ